MQPGRSEEISRRIERAFTANPEAVLSATKIASEIGEPIGRVSYAFIRLEQAGKVENLGALPKGSTVERLYRLPTGDSQ
jgi:predicted Rossmann fold nucleotide-binding protein DprA/Smf involved in DNA uptake